MPESAASIIAPANGQIPRVTAIDGPPDAVPGRSQCGRKPCAAIHSTGIKGLLYAIVFMYLHKAAAVGRALVAAVGRVKV
jgi:hypothetical protein